MDTVSSLALNAVNPFRPEETCFYADENGWNYHLNGKVEGPFDLYEDALMHWRAREG